MRALADLLRTTDGVSFLAEKGIFVSREAFVAELRYPAKPDLATLLGIDPRPALVYVGQQVCADYALATATKFVLARDLGRTNDVVTTILWHDMYQADADRFGTRILPPSPNARGIWFVPRSVGSQEPRFLRIEPARLEEAFASLRAWLGHVVSHDAVLARSRLEELIQSVHARAPTTLSEATGAIAEHLLRVHFDFEPPTTSASRMADAGLFDSALSEVLADLGSVRRVFNRSIEALLEQDIDPQVRPLPEDYLPLHYSDPESGERMRLRHERSGPDHWAVASNRRGETHRLHLGSSRVSLGELATDRRWSLDVSMPLYHNDLASGWIAGRSTALYGIVFNEVLRDVLGRKPIPALIPLALGDESDGDPSRTILFEHLLGGESASR